MRKQPTQIIKKLKKEIFILFSIIIFLGVIFILDFNGRGSVIALTGNYNKQSGDQLTADDWNKLDEDFLGVNTSVLGSSIIKEVPNAKLNINGYADSGEMQLKTNINPSHWAVYAHKDYGDLNFWYNANLLTIDKDNGNVGIGDNSPDKKLSVNGDINATGDICSGGKCLSDIQALICPEIPQYDSSVNTGWKSIVLPLDCTSGSGCVIKQVIYTASTNSVKAVRRYDYFQDPDDADNWFSSANKSGKNGDVTSTDIVPAYSSNTIILRDDYTGTDTLASSWAGRDNTATYYQKVYICTYQ